MKKENESVIQEKFKTLIGGQALIEGIMMQGPDKRSIVVRGPEGIVTKVEPLKKRTGIAKWPLIRGVVNFASSMVSGVKALMYSAAFFPEEEDAKPSKFDEWLEKKLGSEKMEKAVISFSVVLGVLFSVGLFFLLPTLISGLFDRVIHSAVIRSLIEGVIRIAIFMGYMILISKMKDMKRVFSYHGAEHKTIRCYEAQLPLTVENCRGMTRLHPRCGTSFLFVVVMISILLFALVSAVLPTSNMLVRLVVRLALLPFVVAISYEFNRLVGRHDNWLTRILTAPGMWFQNFTTNEPDDSMLDLYLQARRALLPTEGENAAAAARELLAFASGKSVAAVLADANLYASEQIEADLNGYVNRMLAHEPLPYILGQWDFYGISLEVTPDVLIPRDDTMAVTDLALEVLRTGHPSPRVLDLCCGSGCIGLAIAHQLPDAHVTLADISRPALAVAKRNIKRLKLMNRVTAIGLDAKKPAPSFVGTLDALVCNPPYVTAEEMTQLEPSVRDYEPALALDGGADGLDFYRAVAENFTRLIASGGYLCFEFGLGQHVAVSMILQEYGYTDIALRKDLRGVIRVARGTKK